jgi:hypothetical protein
MTMMILGRDAGGALVLARGEAKHEMAISPLYRSDAFRVWAFGMG